MNLFLKTLKLKKNEKTALKEAEIKYFDVKNWCELGRENKENYNNFLKEYQKISRTIITKNEKYEFKKDTNKTKRNSFIYYLENNTIKKGLSYAKLTTKQFALWKKYGDLKIKPFSEFVEEYEKEKDYIIKEKLEEMRQEEANKLFLKGYKVFDVINEIDKTIIIKEEEFINYYKNQEKEIEGEIFEIEEQEEESINGEDEDDFLREPAFKFINLFKEGYEINQSRKMCDLTNTQINNWNEKGKEKISPYDEFYKKYQKIKRDIQSEKRIFKKSKECRERLILEIKNKKSLKKACEESELELKLVEEWLIKGMENIIPYNEFYEEYKYAKKESTKHNKKHDLKLTIVKETKENLEVTINGKADIDDVGLTNILKTFKDEIIEIQTQTIKNKINVLMKLNIKKESLNFLKSLID